MRATPSVTFGRAITTTRIGPSKAGGAAAALNCSVGTVKSQASRALAALRDSAELMEGELQ